VSLLSFKIGVQVSFPANGLVDRISNLKSNASQNDSVGCYYSIIGARFLYYMSLSTI